MVDSVAGSSSQIASYGGERIARFGAQSSKQAAGRAGEKNEKADPVGELSQEQQRQVEALAKRDREVRQHEQAHLTVGRDLVQGGPVYAYETGPDKKRYVVSGEVTIDSSPGRTPEETIPKAAHIRETALAPAEPSPQDRLVAAKASRMEAQARIELANTQRADSATTDQERYGGQLQEDGQSPRPGALLDVFA